MKTHLFYWMIILGIAVIILLQRSCDSGKPVVICPEGGKPAITQVSDTTQNNSSGDSSYKPVKPVTRTKPVIVKPEPEVIYVPDGNYDSLLYAYYDITERFTLLDSLHWELMQQFLTINHYRDSINLVDKASGNVVATVYLNDSIRSNELWSRDYLYNLSLPVITNTTTITIPPKPVNQLYAGIEFFGRKGLIDAAGVNLMLKTKRDKVYTLHGGYNNTYRDWYVGLDTKWKIRLRR